ncbi:MAG: hypothetical protein ACI9KE_004389 [Polyangiales bacterium]|jgi:hypothetical protein
MWTPDGLSALNSGTTFGVVIEGVAALTCASGTFALKRDMYFSVTGEWELRGGRGLCVRAEGYEGVFQIGGPIEALGRLRYINGCTDSLLLGPLVCGDPCLNFLHLPEGSKQAMHLHPSVRAGVVLSGHGVCVTPNQEFALTPGSGFVIDAHLRHAFRPARGDLRVAAFHPDSDTGPTHENHPMLNRTWVSSASYPAVDARSRTRSEEQAENYE